VKNVDLPDEDLLLASTEDAFANLVLPTDGKHLFQSLVEATTSNWDSMISSKGEDMDWSSTCSVRLVLVGYEL
jgi:hypothetical protein